MIERERIPEVPGHFALCTPRGVSSKPEALGLLRCFAALRPVLAITPILPADPAQLAAHFTGKTSPKRLSEISAILETLRLLGQI